MSFVSVKPGATILHLILILPNSLEKTLIAVERADLELAYATLPGFASIAAELLMATIDPFLFFKK